MKGWTLNRMTAGQFRANTKDVQKSGVGVYTADCFAKYNEKFS